MSDLLHRLQTELQENRPAHVVLLVEMSLLPVASRRKLSDHPHLELHPLLTQPELANLRMIGPALITVRDGRPDPLRTLIDLAPLARPGLCAWLTTRLTGAALAKHLSAANTLRCPDGETYLLRWHVSHVTDTLFLRQDAWTDAFFGPLISWWAMEPDAARERWRRYPGGARITPAPLPILHANADLWTHLVGDDHEACAVLGELQRLETSPFDTDCLGRRLGLVRQYLARSDEQGLRRPGDRRDFVWLALAQPQLLTSEAGRMAMARACDGEGRLGDLLRPHRA